MYVINYKQMYNSAPGRYSLNKRVRVPTSRGDPGLPRPPQPRAVDGRTDGRTRQLTADLLRATAPRLSA